MTGFEEGGAARKLTALERSALRLVASSGDYQEPKWREILRSTPAPESLTPAWTPLIPHPEQIRLFLSPARFKVVAAGRRSGKTERAIRYLVLCALADQLFPDANFVLCAPTRDQAKQIFWKKLKALIPKWARAKEDSETELAVFLKNGATIRIVGLDKPQRLEGNPIDGCIVDEFAEVKPDAWGSSIRPALSTMGRPGWCWFIGRPKGRGHFWQLVRDFGLPEEVLEWDYFHWKSSDILDPKEIASAKRDLDPLTFRQEYEAEFVTFEGRAYYCFEREQHAVESLRYDPNLPLVLCFDFNVAPGVCAYVQEQPSRSSNPKVAPNVSAVIGEVWIPKNSNTPAVCRRIAADWGPGGALAGREGHKSKVFIYGDSTGGARHTSGVLGSDWDLITNELKPIFRERMVLAVGKTNPFERDRLNAVNSRLKSADGTIRLLVDPKAAPHVAEDLEECTLLEGGSGELDKKTNPDRTHMSDALGYYIADRWPVSAPPDPRSTR